MNGDKLKGGTRKLRGKKLKVVWAEFSTLKMGVFAYTLQ
jgi:hypothetical protein